MSTKAATLIGLADHDVPLVPVIYARALVGLLEQEDINYLPLLTSAGIHPSCLHDPESHLSFNQMARLFRRAQTACSTPALGFRYGLRLDYACHGMLSLLMMRNTSFPELVRIGINYLRIRMPLMDFALTQDDDGVSILLLDTIPLNHMRPFIVEVFLGSLYRLTSAMTRHVVPCFDFSPTSGISAFEQLTDGVVQFGALQNRLWAPRHALCTQSQDDSAPQASDLLAVVQTRREITNNPGRSSTLELVADALGYSPRTLRRHLQQAGLSFSELRNDVRRSLAMRYLKDWSLDIADIAERLGYSDPANFTKAFRGWCGVTPGQYRRQGSPGEPREASLS